MSGEDVYDLARNWCHVCDTDHTDCDPTWLDNLDYICIVCDEVITNPSDEAEYLGSWAHRKCRYQEARQR